MNSHDIELEATVRAAGLLAMREWIEGTNNRHAVCGCKPIFITDDELHSLVKIFLSTAAKTRANLGSELSALDRLLSRTPLAESLLSKTEA